jgi:hypothetical protein
MQKMVTLEFNRSRGGWKHYNAKIYGEKFTDFENVKVDFYLINNLLDKIENETFLEVENFTELEKKELKILAEKMGITDHYLAAIDCKRYKDGNFILVFMN